MCGLIKHFHGPPRRYFYSGHVIMAQEMKPWSRVCWDVVKQHVSESDHWDKSIGIFGSLRRAQRALALRMQKAAKPRDRIEILEQPLYKTGPDHDTDADSDVDQGYPWWEHKHVQGVLYVLPKRRTHRNKVYLGEFTDKIYIAYRVMGGPAEVQKLRENRLRII
jgi:hypothetical protein